MTDRDHRELAKVLNAAEGMVAVSNYECELMEELFPADKWHKHLSPEKTIHSTKDKRVEVLWTNFDRLKPKRLTKPKAKASLFDEAC